MTQGVNGRMTTKELHAEHWRYVCRMLSRYGVPWQDVEDMAQEVWVTVEQRIHTFDMEIHRSWRAWITGIVRRCSANYRRREGRAVPPVARPAPAIDKARSQRLLAKMDRAAEQKQLALVLALAEEHERLFGSLDRSTREGTRSRALNKLGQGARQKPESGSPSP